MESKGFKIMELLRKLEILADAAKYDASCASGGTEMRDSGDGKGLGSTAPGPGHLPSYAPEGRCISLLKILLTNACNYDCPYCINHASSNVPRARFTVDEVVKLTIDFYRAVARARLRHTDGRAHPFHAKGKARSGLQGTRHCRSSFSEITGHSSMALGSAGLRVRLQPKPQQLGFGF
jgi:hypothetical protein